MKSQAALTAGSSSIASMDAQTQVIWIALVTHKNLNFEDSKQKLKF